jgi:hypothetical protein
VEEDDYDNQRKLSFPQVQINNASFEGKQDFSPISSIPQNTSN